MRVLMLIVLVGACAHRAPRTIRSSPSWSTDSPRPTPIVIGAPLKVEADVSNELAGHTPDDAAGEIHGVLIDAHREPMPGVTVLVESPVATGPYAAITDELGRYVVGQLPPGVYAVSFYLNDAVFRHDGVTVEAGRVVEQRVTGWREIR